MKTLLAVLVLSAMAANGPALAGDCMQSDAAGQFAQGRLTVGRFRDAADRAESAYILTLSAPACLDSRDPEARVGDALTIHIYSADDAMRVRIGRAVGSNVRVWGRPFAAHTAHHHAPIVMEITRLATRKN